MQIQDNQQLPLSVQTTDEQGNPTPGTTALSVDNSAVISLTDNGDGTGMAVALGLGSATVTATHTDPDGTVTPGTEPIEVIAGDTTTVQIVPGTPEPKVAGAPSGGTYGITGAPSGGGTPATPDTTVPA